MRFEIGTGQMEASPFYFYCDETASLASSTAGGSGGSGTSSSYAK